VQTYEHMGAVNSITFVDENRRFVSSSDDKVIRVWDVGIPICLKYISDPTMHSCPVTVLHPNTKWIGCQSMDNNVRVYGVLDRFKLNAKKHFDGHLVAGYACGLAFSPDGRFMASGDSMGRAFFWDWKTSRMIRAMQGHKGVCIDVSWHPTVPSRVATCGWDGDIKLWD
jgi:pre-mRNA-processing factor 17